MPPKIQVNPDAHHKSVSVGPALVKASSYAKLALFYNRNVGSKDVHGYLLPTML